MNCLQFHSQWFSDRIPCFTSLYFSETSYASFFFSHTCLIKISKIKSLFKTPYWQSPFNVSSFLPYHSFFSNMQLFYYVQIMLFSYHILIFLITNYMWGYISFRNINVKGIIFKHFLKTANSISGLGTLRSSTRFLSTCFFLSLISVFYHCIYLFFIEV